MEGHNFESNIFKETGVFHLSPSTQEQEEEEALEDQRRRNEELHDLLEGAFTDITNENSEDDSDFQSTFNATESVNTSVLASRRNSRKSEKLDQKKFQDCLDLLNDALDSIRMSTVKMKRNKKPPIRKKPIVLSTPYPSTTPKTSIHNSFGTPESSNKKSTLANDDIESYFTETYTVLTSTRSVSDETLHTFSSNVRSPISSETEHYFSSETSIPSHKCSETTYVCPKGHNNGQWNDDPQSEYESGNNVYSDSITPITTPKYDNTSVRHFYDDGLSQSNVDSSSDSHQISSQSSYSRPRRRYWSTQHVSSLTPLKEIDVVNSEMEIDNQLIEQYNNIEISDTKQLKILYQARVRDVEKLSNRVEELESTLKTQTIQKDSVISMKDEELDRVNMTFDVNKQLLVEAQLKIKEYEENLKKLSKENEKLANEKEVLSNEKTKTEHELDSTRTALVETEQRLIFSRSKTIDDHVEQIQNLNLKHKEEINNWEQIVQEKGETIQDMQRRITDLTRLNENLMTEKYDLTVRMNKTLHELSYEREQSRKAIEESLKLKDVATERDQVKSRAEELECKLREVVNEFAKIDQVGRLNRDRSQQTVLCMNQGDLLTTSSLEIELKRSLDSLNQKRGEICHMKRTISEQQQMIMVLSGQTTVNISRETQTYPDDIPSLLAIRNVESQSEQIDLTSDIINEFKLHVNRLEQELSKKDIHINEYQLNIEQLETNLKDLQENLDNNNKINDYDRLYKDYEKLTSDYIKRGEMIQNLQSELESLRNDFISLQEECNQPSPSTSRQNIDMNTSLDTSTRSYHQLFNTIRNELKSMASKNKTLKAMLMDKTNELLYQIAENDDLRTELVNHESCMRELNALRETLEIRNRNSEAFQSVISGLKEKMKECEERLQQIIELENSNKSLRQQLKYAADAYSCVRREIHSMRTSLAIINGEPVTEYDDNAGVDVTLKQLETVKHAYESIIEDKAHFIDDQSSEIHTLQRQVEKYRSFDIEIREAIEKQIQELQISCEEKMADAQVQCCEVLTTEPENLSPQEDTPRESPSTVNRVNELVNELKRIKSQRDKLEEKYLNEHRTAGEANYRVQRYEAENARLISKLQHARADLEHCNDKMENLHQHELTVTTLKKQLRHLELTVQRYKSQSPSSAAVRMSLEMKDLQHQISSMQAMHAHEVEKLQESLKDVMRKEMETIQNEFQKKIIQLESEKSYLKNYVQTLEKSLKELREKSEEEKLTFKTVLESNTNQMNEMTLKIASYERYENDWKDKESALIKEKFTLSKGVDKFARAMLELYIKSKHMTGEIKRIKEEKHSCFEYAYCLKKKINALKDRDQHPHTRRIHRSLSESSTPLNITALEVTNEIMKNKKGERPEKHQSHSTKCTVATSKLPVLSTKVKTKPVVKVHKRPSRSAQQQSSVTSLDAPQVVEAYRNRNNRPRKTSKE